MPAMLDDEIDLLEHNLNDRTSKLIQEYPDKAICFTYQLWIIHQLELTGVRVTNIAESVFFWQLEKWLILFKFKSH